MLCLLPSRIRSYKADPGMIPAEGAPQAMHPLQRMALQVGAQQGLAAGFVPLHGRHS